MQCVWNQTWSERRRWKFIWNKLAIFGQTPTVHISFPLTLQPHFLSLWYKYFVALNFLGGGPVGEDWGSASATTSPVSGASHAAGLFIAGFLLVLFAAVWDFGVAFAFAFAAFDLVVGDFGDALALTTAALGAGTSSTILVLSTLGISGTPGLLEVSGGSLTAFAVATCSSSERTSRSCEGMALFRNKIPLNPTTNCLDR